MFKAALKALFPFLALSIGIGQTRISADEQAKARAVANAFVADLVAGHAESALARWERRDPQYEQFLKTNIQMCGLPLSSEPENAGKPETGDAVYQNGSTKPTLIFLYSCKPEGSEERSWSVEIQPGDHPGVYYVTGIGCQTMHKHR